MATQEPEGLDPGPRQDRVLGAHPADLGTEQRAVGAQQVAVAVGHGQPGARQGAQRQLVAVVGLGPAVPVEVVGAERGDAHDRGGRGQIGGLEARDLHHPEVELVAEPPGPRGGPMLPATMARSPRPPRRCPATAAVVDLPLVPVMQVTRSRSASWSHRPEAAGDDHPGGLEGGHLGTGPG